MGPNPGYILLMLSILWGHTHMISNFLRWLLTYLSTNIRSWANYPKSKILPRLNKFKVEERKIWWHKSPMKNQKVHFSVFFTNKYFFYIKTKLMVSKGFYSDVNLLIWCILDYDQHHLVDFWEKFPTDLNFIWIEQNSYNSGVLFQIVWSCTSIFKLESFLREGWVPKTCYLCIIVKL